MRIGCAENNGLPFSSWFFHDFKKVVALWGDVLFYDEEEEDGTGTWRSMYYVIMIYGDHGSSDC